MVFSLLVSCTGKENPNEKPGPSEEPSGKEWSFGTGVCRQNLFWLKNSSGAAASMEEQKAMLEDIASTGCKNIRLVLANKNVLNDVVEHIKCANALGMKVTLMINFSGNGAFYPAGTQALPRVIKNWSSYPLSKLNLKLYEEQMRSAMEKFKENGCSIDVIEVGNEPAWCAFNGDFPVGGRGVIYGDKYGWGDLPSGVAVGLRKLGRACAVTKSLVAEILGADSGTKVIFGGINGADTAQWRSWCLSNGGTLLEAGRLIMLLKGTLPGQPETETDNLLEGMDGMGIHMYPQPRYLPTNTEGMISDAINYIDDFVGPVAEQTDLPLHVTEMGIRYTLCGWENDHHRLTLFQCFFDAMEELKDKYNWYDILVYGWDHDDFALYKDGKFSYTAQHLFK